MDDIVPWDDIEARLREAGLPDSNSLIPLHDLVPVLYAEGITDRVLDSIIDLGGAQFANTNGTHGVVNEDDWRSLVRLLHRTNADTVRMWREQTPLPDALINIYYDRVTPKVAVLLDAYSIVDDADIDEIAARFAARGITWDDAAVWYEHELLTDFDEASVNMLARWISALGDRAYRYAAAGLSLEEAQAREKQDGYDPDALAALAALRGISDELALLSA